MNRRWRISLIVGACAMLAIVMALVWPGEREPEYKGRKLSVWTYRAMDPKLQPADKAERIEAVHHIGTNALPYLLKWIEGGELPKQYNKFDTVAIRVVTKATARRWLAYRNRKFYRGTEACWAFEVLGTNASPAVPELTRLSHSTNGWVAALASDALKHMEKKATPSSCALGIRTRILWGTMRTRCHFCGSSWIRASRQHAASTTWELSLIISPHFGRLRSSRG